MKIGIYSGTFDPLHNGHLYVIEQAAKVFEKVFVVLGYHPGKKPMFSKTERIQILMETIKQPNVVIDHIDEGYWEDYVRSNFTYDDEVTFIRGVRNVGDFANEKHLALANLYPTWLVLPPLELYNCSSTEIKKDWDQAKDLVPPAVLKLLRERETANLDLETTRLFFDKLVDEKFISLEKTISRDQVKKMLDPVPVDVTSSTFYHLCKIDIDAVEPLGERWVKHSRSVGPIIVDANPAWIEGIGFKYLENFPSDDGMSLQQCASGTYDLDVDFQSIFHTSTSKHLVPFEQTIASIFETATAGFAPAPQEFISLDNEDVLGLYGKIIIIEGKHRWLDAKERGEKQIWAWVGESALGILKNSSHPY